MENSLPSTIGYGNGLNNTLTGNYASNWLDGQGGADTMTGGRGNDTYVVDNAADQVIENPGEGTDTVRAWISETLAANVENLVLWGSANTNGFGNALDNTLTGSYASNWLDGEGGADTAQAVHARNEQSGLGAYMGQFTLKEDSNSTNLAAVQALVNDFNNRAGAVHVRNSGSRFEARP